MSVESLFLNACVAKLRSSARPDLPSAWANSPTIKSGRAAMRPKMRSAIWFCTSRATPASGSSPASAAQPDIRVREREFSTESAG